MSSIIYENSNYPPEKSDIPLALRTEKCNNILALLLLVRDASVMGFMSGGMVADTASEGFCNYLFTKTIPATSRSLRAITAFKDEYLLDFINVEELGARDGQDVDERVVENAIVHNVKNFILAFGKDFTFVRNQYHLDAFGEDQYIDLLFFNRELNCLVAVELKTGKFKTSYLGQLQGYLSVLDGFERKPHENPSIGIILCKDMNKSFVDYVI